MTGAAKLRADVHAAVLRPYEALIAQLRAQASLLAARICKALPKPEVPVLTRGEPCPRCGNGKIVSVHSRRAPPKRYYNNQVGQPGPQRTAYRCSEGCAWIETEKK